LSPRLVAGEEHERHRKALDKHNQDLAAYRKMPEDPPD
jgi:hypothetical protein